MELTRITEVTEQYGVSSRTLRYYEEVGLIKSERPAFEKYRFYDKENVDRLQQILVLRKMQIPVKDIMRIYESQDMEVLVQSFVNRLEEIDDEISTLSQIRNYVDDFLNAMIAHGITQISALPLLYEKMEEELSSERNQSSGEVLGMLNEKAAKPLEIDIVTLPSMFVMTSLRRDTGRTDTDGFWDWFSANQVPLGRPGSRTFFEYQHEGEIVFMQKIEEEANVCPFECQEFTGGFFAVTSAYTDEDLGALQSRMLQSFDDNPGFEVDFLHNGKLRHDTLLETVYSLDTERERVNVYLPVKERKPYFTDFNEYELVQDITAKEIEEANPVLKSYTVDFTKVTPIYSPHYKVLENGEAEYIAWISERKLDTNIAVKLPFRVDIEFLAEEKSEQYLWGTNEGSMWFSHNNLFYILNDENYADQALKKHAIKFFQPVLGNEISLPGLGYFPHDQYNKMSWILGEKHFAVIVNEEVRFCGRFFPYMAMDLYLQTPQPVIIGTNGQGKKLFRSITISQLKLMPKSNSQRSSMLLDVKQSNNILPNLRQIVHPEYGQNYWFNGCAAFLMECAGEKEYDYDFFGGLTGDNFAQIYSKNHFRGNGAVDFRLSEKKKHGFLDQILWKCGYESRFVPIEIIRKNRDEYVKKLMAYIDRGLPVITNDYGKNPNNRFGWSVLVGYSHYGKTILYLGGDGKESDTISVDDLLPDVEAEEEQSLGWLFLGKKIEDKKLADIYREVIMELPSLLTTETDNFFFGANAFRAFADRIESGFYEKIRAEEFDIWELYTSFICSLATNYSVSPEFLRRALELNPDMLVISDLLSLMETMSHYWNNDEGKDLEALGGGFNVTLEALTNKTKREKIAAKIREFALCTDSIVDRMKAFNENSSRNL